MTDALRVRHACPFCGSLSRLSAAAIAENPFCAGCLHERIALAVGSEPFRVKMVEEGDKVRFVRERIES